MIWIGIVFIVFYVTAIGLLCFGNFKLKRFSSEEKIPETSFSIVIPFRNEAENLPTLIASLQNLNYPQHLFEIILVNDASEDASKDIIYSEFQTIKQSKGESILQIVPDFKVIENVRNSGSPKKDAIRTAIEIVSNEWIITTDADCSVPKNWLNQFNAIIKKKDAVMVCGPIFYKSKGNFIESFQQLDGLSLQAVTIGSFGLGNALLCNGANLGYKKSAFLEVEGFTNNDHIASGDDIFMLEKMKTRFPDNVVYLKNEEAIVTTLPEKSWENIINQRIRWASKTSKQQNPFSKILGFLVFLTNLFLVFGLVYCFFNQAFIIPFIIIVEVKLLVDFIALHQVSRFFNARISYVHYYLSFFLYPFLTVWVVLNSFRRKYDWKGRSFKT